MDALCTINLSDTGCLSVCLVDGSPTFSARDSNKNGSHRCHDDSGSGKETIFLGLESQRRLGRYLISTMIIIMRMRMDCI